MRVGAHLLAFDSGIGGYGIVGALRARLPGARITMLADNAFYPYGEVTDAALVARIGHVIAEAIRRFAPDAVVIACNTASTVALAPLRARFALPFIGCVPPIKWAASISRTRTIGLLATAATVRRPYLSDLARRFAPDCRLIAHGARGLADMAEAAFREQPIDHGALRSELDALFGQEGGGAVDVVCIGCTHYSFLLDALCEASRPGSSGWTRRKRWRDAPRRCWRGCPSPEPSMAPVAARRCSRSRPPPPTRCAGAWRASAMTGSRCSRSDWTLRPIGPG